MLDTPTTIYAHGSGGLFSAPGIGGGLRRKRRSKRRTKAAMVTLAQLEAFVSSPAYTPDGANALAAQITALPRLKGEQIAPGITRIHGNLCNVHGKYGPCDAALSGKKKPAKGRKPRKAAKPKKVPQTPEQHAQALAAKRQANVDSVAKRMADSDTGLSPSGVKALAAFAQGQQPDSVQGPGLAKMGLAEQATDGSYRMTPTGRAAVSAMQAGDYQRTIDTISRGTDARSARTTRQTAAQARTQAAADRHAAAQAKQAARLAKQGKPPRAASGAKPSAKPATVPAGASSRNPAPKPHGPSHTSGGHARSVAPKPKPPAKVLAPAKAPAAPAKQIAPALTDAVQRLSDGKASDDEVQTLVRNGLAKVGKDGQPILTAAGLRATKKAVDDYPDQSQFAGHTMEDWDDGLGVRKPSREAVEAARKRFAQALGVDTVAQPAPSFSVFKDARGQYRWIAFSSTAYRDRDGEIVSTKALADDCATADRTGQYGVLDWWHMPSIVLGDCDFNAMHGRVLIESGTFRSPAIAEKVAQADLEVSLAFLHPPTDPDAHRVYHHIRRFARGLTPRGKASNLFTSFHVKESPMDETKKAALKSLGFSDTEISDLEARAVQTQKAADVQGVAYKADDPELPDLVINGVTYKAFPPKAAAAAAPDAEDAAEPPETPGEVPDAEDLAEGEEPEGGLTLSPEDIDAIGASVGGAITQAIAPLMGLLDIEKKMQGHVQTMMAPFAQQKDAERAETQQQITALTATIKAQGEKLAELNGDRSAAAIAGRATSWTDNVIAEGAQNAQLLAAAKAQQPGAGPWDDIAIGMGIMKPGV